MHLAKANRVLQNMSWHDSRQIGRWIQTITGSIPPLEVQVRPSRTTVGGTRIPTQVIPACNEQLLKDLSRFWIDVRVHKQGLITRRSKLDAISLTLLVVARVLPAQRLNDARFCGIETSILRLTAAVSLATGMSHLVKAILKQVLPQKTDMTKLRLQRINGQHHIGIAAD